MANQWMGTTVQGVNTLERERVMGYNSTTRIYTLLQIENSVLKNGNVGEVK